MSPISINPLALLLVLTIGAAGGWTAQGWRLNADLADLRANHADGRAAQSEATVTAMQADARIMSEAAKQFTDAQGRFGAKFDSIKKGMKNAPPLDPKCRPDDVRLHSLDAAIEAANASTSGQ